MDGDEIPAFVGAPSGAHWKYTDVGETHASNARTGVRAGSGWITTLAPWMAVMNLSDEVYCADVGETHALSALTGVRAGSGWITTLAPWMAVIYLSYEVHSADVVELVDTLP